MQNIHRKTFTYYIHQNLLKLKGFYKEIPKTLGECIRKLRVEKRLTAKELAKKLNCSDTILFEWEKEKRIPLINYLRRLHEKLEIPDNILRKAVAQKYSLSKKESNLLFNIAKIKKLLQKALDKKTDYGILLRLLRYSLLITHKEFAMKLNVNPSTLLDSENGRHRPNNKMLEKLIKKY